VTANATRDGDPQGVSHRSATSHRLTACEGAFFLFSVGLKRLQCPRYRRALLFNLEIRHKSVNFFEYLAYGNLKDPPSNPLYSCPFSPMSPCQTPKSRVIAPNIDVCSYAFPARFVSWGRNTLSSPPELENLSVALCFPPDSRSLSCSDTDKDRDTLEPS